MKKPEYIVHGTASEKDAKNIEKEGFCAEEGRATVSTNLAYAYEWATDVTRRRGSKSESIPNQEEMGRILVMKAPNEMSVDYSSHSDVVTNNEEKEISGYVDKYISGKKQLALYGSANTGLKREELEKNKAEISSLKNEFDEYIRGLKLNNVTTFENLEDGLKNYDLDKKLEILKKIEDYKKEINEKRKLAEPDLLINRENILLSIRPSEELGALLKNFVNEITSLKNPDISQYLDELLKVVNKDKENYVATNDPEKVFSELLRSTIESVVVNKIRSLSLDVKRVLGYKLKDVGDVEYPDKDITYNEVMNKLTTIKRAVDRDGFIIGSEVLTRYVRENIDRLLVETKANED